MLGGMRSSLGLEARNALMRPVSEGRCTAEEDVHLVKPSLKDSTSLTIFSVSRR